MDKSTMLPDAIRAVCRQLKNWRVRWQQRRMKIEILWRRQRHRAECCRILWRYRLEVQQ
jgi:hypothetical protein